MSDLVASNYALLDVLHRRGNKKSLGYKALQKKYGNIIKVSVEMEVNLLDSEDDGVSVECVADVLNCVVINKPKEDQNDRPNHL